ncbi:phosphoglucomutase/phosphomannomutase family protein [Candidatus Kapabacteria bacterium]|nr:phosphoglucomutase/phosphomannomutase family protein [Candidatus Kapabacteria bacterium]
MIKFGTDGWRAIIADQFTFENVRFVALGAAKYLKNKKQDNKVVVGYDTRFLSANFAEEVARVLASEGIKVLLADKIASTPQTSYNTLFHKADLGIVITASHNPAEYSGFKVKGSFGGPSIPSEVKEIETQVNKYMESGFDFNLKSTKEYIQSDLIEYFDAKETYLNYIKEKIDLDAINNSGLNILFDPMHGAGIDTISDILTNAEEIHFDHNPGFGTVDHPEPIAICLEELIEIMKAESYDLGFATDGDADRLGLVDSEGTFVDSHKLFMILLKYLNGTKKLTGKVAKTISLTTMVDLYCEKYGLELIKTAVGFKYIAELMVEDNILIGGEESGGLSTLLHIPERDGIFNALLIMEVMVKTGKSLKQLCDELTEEFGPHTYERRDVKVSEDTKKKVLAAAASRPSMLGDHKVISSDDTDGFKFFVENGWLLIRASGTEPLLRFYAEAENLEKVDQLLKAGLALG